MSRAGSTSEVDAGEGILVELRNVIEVSQESRAEAMQAEMSLAAVLASVAARKNSCAHVTADQEVSVKTLAEEMKSVADATQVLGSETGPVERRTDALFQVRFSTGAPTRLEEHSAALSQLVSRASAVMKFGPGAVEDPFVEVKQLITDSMNRLQSQAFVRGRPHASSRL